MQRDFLTTFCTTDFQTVKAVREHYIPKLQAEIAELEKVNDECEEKTGERILTEIINEKRIELSAALARLETAAAPRFARLDKTEP